ncbi:MAG: hypothetical protein HQL13_07220, partial [Candidatus Omnitrophica bacterium]|nr:hypothetical protein [Candidatus Omnitrophota bacterium]
MKLNKFCHKIVLVIFVITGMDTHGLARADEGFYLSSPGTMLHLSQEFAPPTLRGIKVYPDDPLHFDFILDRGDSKDQNVIPAKAGIQNQQFKDEATKLFKYFLAALTVPDEDLWVNLSPYEKRRIIPHSFGLTEMGRDLLAEDYILKQITASLMYPEGKTGKKFWERIYKEASQKYGTTNVPVNTFNKVWIVPQKAAIYENTDKKAVYVVESKLKVMLEEDYLALNEQKGTGPCFSRALSPSSSQIIREVIIPVLTREVNEGQNFAVLRQIYHSLILAAWYKNKIKDSIINQVYTDKNKIAGIGSMHHDIEFIYNRYLQAFKKGAYNYIKEERDPLTHSIIPKKYFSGGFAAGRVDMTKAMVAVLNRPVQRGRDMARISVRMRQVFQSGDKAMTIEQNDFHFGQVIGSLLDRLKSEYVTRRGVLEAAETLKLLSEAGLITAVTIPQDVKDLLEIHLSCQARSAGLYAKVISILVQGKLFTAKDLPKILPQRLFSFLKGDDFGMWQEAAEGLIALKEAGLITTDDIDPGVIEQWIQKGATENQYLRKDIERIAQKLNKAGLLTNPMRDQAKKVFGKHIFDDEILNSLFASFELPDSVFIISPKELRGLIFDLVSSDIKEIQGFQKATAANRRLGDLLNKGLIPKLDITEELVQQLVKGLSLPQKTISHTCAKILIVLGESGRITPQMMKTSRTQSSLIEALSSAAPGVRRAASVLLKVAVSRQRADLSVCIPPLTIKALIWGLSNNGVDGIVISLDSSHALKNLVEAHLLTNEDIVIAMTPPSLDAVSEVFQSIDAGYDKDALQQAYAEFLDKRLTREIQDSRGRYYFGEESRIDYGKTQDLEDVMQNYRHTPQNTFFYKKYGIVGGRMDRDIYQKKDLDGIRPSIGIRDYFIADNTSDVFAEMFFVMGEERVNAILHINPVQRVVDLLRENGVSNPVVDKRLASIVSSCLIINPHVKLRAVYDVYRESKDQLGSFRSIGNRGSDVMGIEWSSQTSDVDGIPANTDPYEASRSNRQNIINVLRQEFQIPDVFVESTTRYQEKDWGAERTDSEDLYVSSDHVD